MCSLLLFVAADVRYRDDVIVFAGQAAIAPAGSAPYRLRSVSILFEPDARVMVWTEFFLFTLFAAFEYTFESGDLRVATAHFDQLAAEYACGQFVTKVGAGAGASTASLVVKDAGQGGVSPDGSSACKYGRCPKINLLGFTENLLENMQRQLRLGFFSYLFLFRYLSLTLSSAFSRDGSMLPSRYADVRSPDDGIAC